MERNHKFVPSPYKDVAFCGACQKEDDHPIHDHVSLSEFLNVLQQIEVHLGNVAIHLGEIADKS